MPPSFLIHLHPKTIHAETARFTLSFGLGGICATLLLILFVTGILQLVSYSPQITSAYDSILQMYHQGNGAGFIRNVHYWSGNLLVIATGLHLLRVFLTGALTGTRRSNWLIGLTLLMLVLFANFTGYLLPWDQLAYWAVTIFTAMLGYIPLVGSNLTTLLRGGIEVGPETLTNFLSIHVGILPALLLILLIYHFWLIRKAGGLIRQEREDGAPSPRLQVTPWLLEKEAATGLAVTAVLLLFSALVDAPLGEQANPSLSPNPAKAAWYFMGLQELLLHLHPVFAICIIPLLITALLALLPFMGGTILPGGTWFAGGQARWTAFGSTVAGIFLTALFIMADNYLMVEPTISPDTAWLSRGVFPVALLVLVLAAVHFTSRSRRKSSAEGSMAVVLFLVGVMLALTATGIWFRGPGMSLSLPF